ncbi:AP-5 complex subunit sigma-1 [Carassius gibelio]|uniref:AP-5 complex subunit sigma-1 n=1 Tax=Carassius gibelio TaxID=101364 RepID=UPI0022787E30|nr:AP-5 complex subunit sigma-1 [Carassius gibelio]XP_052469405.1 AP-5 complex subunit sigma-1 [Carassius gibelio]
MVVCFLIHTVCPVSALSAGESRILYARVFGPETGDGCDFTPEQRRLMQKEKLHVVARQVRSAVALSREASGAVCVEAVLGEEAAALGEADSGVFSLGSAELFPDRSVVLWLGVQSLAFTLVCSPHENLLLAEGTLRNIARHCLEELRLLGPGAEVLLKSDRVDALLHRLLPHGQLLFLNHRFAFALDKEIASYVSK